VQLEQDFYGTQQRIRIMSVFSSFKSHKTDIQIFLLCQTLKWLAVMPSWIMNYKYLKLNLGGVLNCILCCIILNFRGNSTVNNSIS
jgi:hypothetical protein